jgi:hypothetical protein
MQEYDNIIKQYEDIALSDKDILQLINNKASIILYPDLYKYKNIDEVLAPYGACVLLFEAKKNYGHWCCIFKVNESTLEFFNPYGGYPDDSLKYIPCHFRKISHQLYPYLSILMYNSPYNLTYNEYSFQKKGANIRTCGRHCAVRLINRYMSLEEYRNFLDTNSKKLGLDYDECVTLITMI